MIFQNISKYAKKFKKIPKNSKIFQNISKYSKIFQNIPKYSRIFQDILKYSRICKNIPDFKKRHKKDKTSHEEAYVWKKKNGF